VSFRFRSSLRGAGECCELRNRDTSPGSFPQVAPGRATSFENNLLDHGGAFSLWGAGPPTAGTTPTPPSGGGQMHLAHIGGALSGERGVRLGSDFDGARIPAGIAMRRAAITWFRRQNAEAPAVGRSR